MPKIEGPVQVLLLAMGEEKKREASQKGFKSEPMEGIEVNMTFREKPVRVVGKGRVRVGEVEEPIDLDELRHRNNSPL